MTELKPCPFCGGQVRYNYNIAFKVDGIWCSTCHMMVKYPRIHMKPKETFGEYEARMAEVWNRREEHHTMKDDTVSRVAVMQSLTKEYNRRRTGDGLKLAWIEKAVNDVPAEPLTINGVTLYMCDPKKNTPCSKTNCFMNGGECMRTTYKEYREEHHGSD